MICPYRKMTETVDGTTREYYMECHTTECPFYEKETFYKNGEVEKECEYCARAEVEMSRGDVRH